MVKKIIFGSILIVTMLLILPSITAVQHDSIKNIKTSNLIEKLQNINFEEFNKKRVDEANILNSFTKELYSKTSGITIILFLLLIFMTLYKLITQEPGYIDVSAQEAKDLIDTTPDLVIIDVSPFYDGGHIPGAVNYYIGDGSLDDAIPTLDINKPYLVYCHVDSASIGGANKLVDAGFDPVYRLEGNYQAWVDAGYPIET
jgi:rhodanese-related sulfurtransferase